MKKILNISAFVLVVIGLLFKANHFPGSNILIVLSGITMLSTLFIFGLKDNKEAGLSDGLNYFLVCTLAVYIVSAIFKFQHWAGAGILMIVSYALAFLLTIILILHKSDFKVSRQFIISFFIFFLLILGTLRNNPISKYLGSGGDTVAEKTAAMDSDSTKTVTPTDK